MALDILVFFVVGYVLSFVGLFMFWLVGMTITSLYEYLEGTFQNERNEDS